MNEALKKETDQINVLKEEVSRLQKANEKIEKELSEFLYFVNTEFAIIFFRYSSRKSGPTNQPHCTATQRNGTHRRQIENHD